MKAQNRSSALVVLSGGQDSTTCLFWTKKYFLKVHAITFDYGQRHQVEIESARIVAAMAGVDNHEVIDVKNVLKSTSPLLSDGTLEQYTDFNQMEGIIGNRVELTFVPMRNTLFLTIAMNRAIHYGCDSVITGVSQEDNANYPDCTGQFIDSIQETSRVSLGVELGKEISILCPLIYMSKAESVILAKTLPGCFEALAYSHTSYDGKYPPTDMNHANVLRANGFEKAGLPDPLVVRAWREQKMDLPETSNYDELR